MVQKFPCHSPVHQLKDMSGVTFKQTEMVYVPKQVVTSPVKHVTASALSQILLQAKQQPSH